MSFSLKSLLMQLFSPFAFGLLALWLALYLFIKHKSQTSFRIAILGISCLSLFSQPYVADLLLYPLEKKSSPLSPSDVQEHQLIWVLACAYHTEGKMNEVSRWPPCSLQRLVQAAIFAHQHALPIVVTGGHFLKDKKRAYAQEAKALLVQLGVDEANITAVNEGTTTAEEFAAIRQQAKHYRLLVISSATHQSRVETMLAQADIKATFVAVDELTDGQLTPYLDIPSVSALQRVWRAAYEYAARLKHYLLLSDKIS